MIPIAMMASMMMGEIHASSNYKTQAKATVLAAKAIINELDKD